MARPSTGSFERSTAARAATERRFVRLSESATQVATCPEGGNDPPDLADRHRLQRSTLDPSDQRCRDPGPATEILLPPALLMSKRAHDSADPLVVHDLHDDRPRVAATFPA